MRGTELTEKSLPLAIQKQQRRSAQFDENQPVSLLESEKRLVYKTLAETEGNKSKAARILGITRKTLQNKLNRYDKK
jgi:two-component system response regulator HydG